jgi:hypothetical protein
MQVTPYRPLDTEHDWALFDRSLGAPSDLSKSVRPFTARFARQFWEREVTADPLKRHPMLLPQGHWLGVGEHGPNWLAEFEQSSLGEVAAFVLRSAGPDKADMVYFVNSREDIYELPLGVFLSNWCAFVAMNDEGPFLCNPANRTYVSFGPNGSLVAGRKP